RLRPSITSRRMSASSLSRSVPNVSSRPAGGRLRTDHLGARIPSAGSLASLVTQHGAGSKWFRPEPCSRQQREHRALVHHHPAVPHPCAGIARIERGQQLADLLGRWLAPLGRGGGGERPSHLPPRLLTPHA